MKSLKISLVLAALLIPSVAFASASQLVGTWSVVTVTSKGKTQAVPAGTSITMTFKADGTWIGTVTAKGKTETESGTYTFTGNTLTTTDAKKKVETSTVTITGTMATFKDATETITAKKIK